MSIKKILQLIKIWHPDIAGNTPLNNAVIRILTRTLDKLQKK